MDKETDIAIIGGGLASFAAAVELEKSGLEVTLVRKAPGAAALSSGAWDLADSPLRYPGQDPEELPSVGENIQEIVRRRPHHPFRVFSEHWPLPDLLVLLKNCTVRALRELPLELKGDASHPMLLVTELGTLKPAVIAQASMAEGDLRPMRSARIFLVGIQGYPPFRAGFIRKALREFQEAHPHPYFISVEAFEVSMPGMAGQASLSAVELAEMLDREERMRVFAKKIAAGVKGKVYSHLLLPPVLGIQNTAAVVETLKEATGANIAETLAAPMSIPGWRLSQAILGYFQKKAYDVIPGEAVGFDGEKGRITSLRIHLGEERIRLRAKKFILAGGKYLGGGVSRRGKFREPVFGLPLFCEGELLDAQSLSRFAHTKFSQPQPFLAAGIRVNLRGQPLDRDGQVLYENLFAAGRILSGFDPAHERCAAGVSLLSGTLAAQGALA